MNVSIVGAGAVGCFYGGKLSKAGSDVTLIARGKTFEYLKNHDLIVKSYQGDFDVKLQVENKKSNISAPNLIILATKSYDTDSVIEQISPFVSDHTTLMSLQNGVENEEKLIESFGKEKILGALCYIGAEVTEIGKVNHSADGKVFFGELDGQNSERTKRILELFQNAKVETHLSENIQFNLWKKFLWNTGFNQVCTIAHVNVGQLLDSPSLQKLLRETMLEVVKLAQLKNVPLTEELVDQTLEYSNKALRAVRPSMLQDAERKKKLEHETFSGYMVREAEKLGLHFPVNRVLHHFLCHMSP